MLGRSLVANFLLALKGPRRVVTGPRSSTLSLSLSMSLSASVSVSLCLRVVLWSCRCVVCCVFWCVCCGVFVCALSWWRCGVSIQNLRVSIRNVPVCTFKTLPCVPAKRAHVETHVRVVPVHTVKFRTYTRARFESTHGGFEWTHHTATAPRQHTHTRTHTPEHTTHDSLPKFGHVGLSRDTEIHQK